jgi:hypothetical protein
VASISIGVLSAETEPAAEVSTIGPGGGVSEGEHFICIRCGEDVTVIVPGFGRASAKYARALGESLLAAAADVERRTQDDPQPVEA